MDPTFSALIEKYPEIGSAQIKQTFSVLWGDVDMAQHVNNLIYLRWAETARIQLFDMIMTTSFYGGIGPILGWQDCKYIFPMTYPGTALAVPMVTKLLEDRFLMTTKIYSIDHNRIAAISQQSIIPYDYKALKKVPIPALWRESLQDLMVS